MRVFGLTGFPLQHSFSSSYFTGKFRSLGITDCEYRLFEVEDSSQLPEVMQTTGLQGLNVTTPHKVNIVPLMHHLHPTADATGAVNTITIRNGQYTGFNTDVQGFRESLLPLLKDHHLNALVLGTGGAARAAAVVLQELGIGVQPVSRKRKPFCLCYNDLDEDTIRNHSLIVNATPVGMYPGTDSCPDIPYQHIQPFHLCFDMIYNPAETGFLKRAAQQGASTKNGLEMLHIQAEESWRIWNS